MVWNGLFHTISVSADDTLLLAGYISITRGRLCNMTQILSL